MAGPGYSPDTGYPTPHARHIDAGENRARRCERWAAHHVFPLTQSPPLTIEFFCPRPVRPERPPKTQDPGPECWEQGPVVKGRSACTGTRSPSHHTFSLPCTDANTSSHRPTCGRPVVTFFFSLSSWVWEGTVRKDYELGYPVRTVLYLRQRWRGRREGRMDDPDQTDNMMKSRKAGGGWWVAGLPCGRAGLFRPVRSITDDSFFVFYLVDLLGPSHHHRDGRIRKR